MKQVLIRKNDQIREMSGSRISFYHKAERVEGDLIDQPGLSISDTDVTKVVIPFQAKIVSGGTLDLDFSLPEAVASKGINLLGAYWDGQNVTAYLRSLQNLPQFINEEDPVLIGTLVQVTSMKQIEDEVLGGQVVSDKSGAVLDIKPDGKKRRNRKK